jgi:hypothetical protein
LGLTVALLLTPPLAFANQPPAPLAPPALSIVATMEQTGRQFYAELDVLRQSYPNVVFTGAWDWQHLDWSLGIQVDQRTTTLFRADGRYLSAENLPHRERYRRLLYSFPRQSADPAMFDQATVERYRRFGSTANRQTAPISSTAFFDAIYQSHTRQAVEQNLRRYTFLGHSLRLHQRLGPPLKAVEEAIDRLAATDPGVASFLASIASIEGYAWREIVDTSGRSFHSMGLALDILPRNHRQHIIYWFWHKQRVGDDWALTPLNQRWSPGEAVIQAFEGQGFIWGGRWGVWDNMHFEYRPELIVGRHLFTRE